MNIDHIGIWVEDLDRMIGFYHNYFMTTSGEKYHNPTKNFTSCFIRFPSGCRIELMHNSGVPALNKYPASPHLGYIHIAVSVGSEKDVDSITENLKKDGFAILDGPRRTGDGYYESVVLDPEGNRVELTV